MGWSLALVATGVAVGTAVRPTVAHSAPVMAGAARAVAPTLPTLVAYVRNGDVYVSRGQAEKRLTTGGGFARPRWSPDGTRIAYLKGGQLWTMRADGTAQRRLTTRPAGGPSWSPDGRWIAFASLSCSGGPGVYRIATAATNATPEVLFPRDCRGEPLPAQPAANPGTAQQAGARTPGQSRSAALSERLRADDAVAWSPDGTKVAFRGGDCESIFDNCLTIGTIATGGEQTVAAYGGGSRQNRGFAVVPNWRADGGKLAWTAYQEGETAAQNEPVHVVEYDVRTAAKRTVGGALDREMAYLDSVRGVVTAQYAGGSWIMVVGLGNRSRVPFHSGSQPSVQPRR